jgi:predicted nucleic acid-binding protein
MPILGSAVSDYLLDTSAVISGGVPGGISHISVITVVELMSGVHAATDPDLRRNRRGRLASVQRLFDPLPVDVDVVSAYDEVDAAVRATGRQPRPRRMDLLIAATALAHELPLVTHNAGDFVGLDGLIHVLDLSGAN